MNVLLLGNGFDLYHNLPTNYNDFLQTVSYLIDHYNPDMKTIGDVFGNAELQSNSKNIKDCYEKHKDTYDKTEIDVSKVNQLIELASDNMWFAYLHNSFNKDLGWIDFEREIAFVLTCFRNIQNEIGMFFSIEHTKLSKEHIYILRRFGFFFEITERRLVGIGSVCETKKEYLLEYPLGSSNVVINREKIIKELFEDLKKLATCLKLYLEIFVDNSLESIKNEAGFVGCKAICSINKTITFNYTNTAERFYAQGDALHLHGNIKGEIILGINPDENDELESIDIAYVAFKKYYQRACIGADDEYLRWLKELSESTDAIKLLIMGHSLDVTDKDIIVELFQQAEEIIILYHNEQAKCDYIKNLIKIFGKTGFDLLRKDRNLSFMSLDMDFSEFKKKREDESYERLVRKMMYEGEPDSGEKMVVV